MQAVVNTYNLNDNYFPTIFPLKFTPTLTWKSLEGEEGAPVAADVVSFDSTAPRKTRKVVSQLQGDIPKISIGRDKTETQMNEYNILKHYASTSEGAQRLLDFIYDDVEFCFKGVNARLEWLGLRALSTGKIVLDSDNNNGVVTESVVDFLVPDAQKGGVAASWSNPETAKPIRDIKIRTKAAKAKGLKLGVAWMNQDTFDNMVATVEVQKAVASWVVKATGLEDTPDLETVNKYMAKNKLPKIIIIDAAITLEKRDNTKTTVDPWEAGVVTFTPDVVCGATWHGPLADDSVESSVATKAKRGHVLIKKFSTEEPLKESTVGLANAFPAWASAQRSFLMDTENTSWTK